MNENQLNYPSTVVEEIKSVLSSGSPDIAHLHTKLEKGLHLSSEDTRRLIYQVVAQLNALLFPPITKLEIIHTEGCNLACAYCFEKEMTGYRSIAPDIARAAIDILFDYSQDQPHLNILHFGGEPTLNFSSIRQITEYAEEKASSQGKTLEFHITSNGLLINEEMANYFARHKIMVLLSVDGLESSHNRFRVDKHGRGTFVRVMKCFENLKKTQGWVGTKMTIMPENVPNLYDDVLGLYERGVNQFLISPASGINWSKEDMEFYGKQWGKLYQWYTRTPRQDLRITAFDEIEDKPAFFGCHAGRNNISVSVNGDISSCSKVLAINNRHPLDILGDVHYGLSHIQNRFELVTCLRLRSACEVKGIAKDFEGGCFASNYEENQDLFQPSMQQYTFQKMIVASL